MNRWTAIATAGVLAAGSATASDTLYVGQLSPRTDGAALLIDIGGESHELVYGQFVAVPVPRGNRVVSVREPGSGNVLVTRQFSISPGPQMTPVLFVAGDGERRPYTLVYEQRAVPITVPVDPDNRVQFAVHHAAIFPSVEQGGDGLGDRLYAQAECVLSLGGSGSAGVGGGDALAFAETWSLNASTSSLSCDFLLAAHAIGGFEISLDPSQVEVTRRLFMIGDGQVQPYELLVMDGGTELARLSMATPAPQPLSRSPNRWFDTSRPDQGVSLYEIGGVGLLFGTWYTFDSRGRPAWYYFEGASSEAVGRRDVAVYRGTRGQGAPTLDIVANGRLQYIDCNEAEFRVVFEDNSMRTLRLRRARSVAFCPVFQ